MSKSNYIEWKAIQHILMVVSNEYNHVSVENNNRR